jgi:hypothetical protein
MPVVVVRADADQSDPGRECPVQLGVLVGGPVVRDLDDVDGRAGLRWRGPEESSLGVLAQVTEEQRADAARARALRCRIDPEHQARRVARAIVALRWPQHPPPQVAEQAARVVGGPSHVDPGAPQVRDDPGVRGPTDRPDQCGVDPRRDRRHRADVVAVEVRECEEVDPVDAEERQTGRQPVGIVPGVDQRRPSTTPEQRGVALSDVAHRDGPPGRDAAADEDGGYRHRPDPDRDRDGRATDQHAAHACGDEDRDRDGRAHRGSGDDPEPTGRPRCRGRRQRSGPVRDQSDAGCGHPPDGREQLGTHRPHRREQARGQAGDGGDRCQDLGHQVRRHGVGRQGGGQRDRDRPAGDLRGDRHRDGRGDRGPHPPRQQLGERRRQDHDPGGRQYRECEREGPGHPRIDDEHARGRDGDERHAPHRSAGQVHEEHHDRHHGRPGDRRVRADEHDEPEQHDHGRDGTHDPWRSDGPSEQHHEGDEDGAVRPGHRGQVRHRRRLHGLLGLRVEPGPVTDREPAEQRRARLR